MRGELAMLQSFHDIVNTVWRQEEVPQAWKDTMIQLLHKADLT